MSTDSNDFFGGTYVTAIYSAIDRSTISATFKDVNNEDFVYHIIADMNEPAYLELLKIVDVETLEKNTQEYCENERSTILALAMEEAIDQGYTLVENIEKILVDLCFNYNPETNIESLFKLKLVCLELDFINTSQNEDIKIEIRDAETPFKVLELVNRLKNEEQ